MTVEPLPNVQKLGPVIPLSFEMVRDFPQWADVVRPFNAQIRRVINPSDPNPMPVFNLFAGTRPGTRERTGWCRIGRAILARMSLWRHK